MLVWPTFKLSTLFGLFFIINVVLGETTDDYTTRELKFFCDFDTDDCGATLTSDLTGTSSNFNFVKNQIISTITITDVTSITKPTGITKDGPFDQPPCKIPFKYVAGRDLWFCTGVGDCVPDQPPPAPRTYCQLGRYLWARTNANGDPFKAELTLENIDLEKPGLFEITFHAVMYCADNLAMDSFSIIVNEESVDSSFVYSVDYTSPDVQSLKWKKMSFEIYLDNPILELKVQFQRFNKSSIGYFVFDEIEIFKLSDTSEESSLATELSTTEDSTKSEELSTITEDVLSSTSYTTTLTSTETTLATETVSEESIPTIISQSSTESDIITDQITSQSSSSSSSIENSFSSSTTVRSSVSTIGRSSETTPNPDETLKSTLNGATEGTETELANISTGTAEGDAYSTIILTNPPLVSSSSSSSLSSTSIIQSSSSTDENPTADKTENLLFLILVVLAAILTVLVICIVAFCVIKYCLKPKPVYPRNDIELN